MFKDLIDFPIESERLRWEACLVVRDLNQEPHLLMRIMLTGTHFPERALEPFVIVGKVRSLFVSIADDGLSARAYFDEPVQDGSRIEFGYGTEVLLRFPRAFERKGIKLLDPKRLPSNTRFIERFLSEGE
jgi:hypothetical protein